MSTIYGSRGFLRLPVSLPLNEWFHTNFLKKTFWVNFKSLIVHNEGLQVNTITRSYSYWLLRGYIFSLRNKKSPLPHVTPYTYLKAVSIVVGLFSKTSFNKQITLSIILLLSPYYGFLNQFNLTCNFLFVSNGFMLLSFFNLFYFKVHTY